MMHETGFGNGSHPLKRITRRISVRRPVRAVNLTECRAMFSNLDLPSHPI